MASEFQKASTFEWTFIKASKLTFHLLRVKAIWGECPCLPSISFLHIASVWHGWLFTLMHKRNDTIQPFKVGLNIMKARGQLCSKLDVVLSREKRKQALFWFGEITCIQYTNEVKEGHLFLHLLGHDYLW